MSSRRSILLLVLALAGCQREVAVVPSVPAITPWRDDWSTLLGQTVTLEGRAANEKLGALLETANNMIWIDGLESWPLEWYPAHDAGKRLRVTCTVIKRGDLPTYVWKRENGPPPRAGIPVETEEERERQRWRFLLKDAKWTVLEP